MNLYITFVLVQLDVEDIKCNSILILGRISNTRPDISHQKGPYIIPKIFGVGHCRDGDAVLRCYCVCPALESDYRRVGVGHHWLPDTHVVPWIPSGDMAHICFISKPH